MRKLILILSLMVICNQVNANTITLETISADSTISVFNNNFSTLANVANGNIEGSSDGGSTVSNIKSDSVFEINMGDDANPRLRDSELVGITVDTISGGSPSAQGSYVYSGCSPATDSDLTSDISACTAYINGYRVTKSATSQTYANNTTTYVWLSQSGVYTQSTNPNTSISNSALLASVVTSGGAITTVNDLANRQLPGLFVPLNYRDGMIVSRDSATTVTVLPGSCEINNSIIRKTSTTTLTISTAGDWAGGSSLRAADTYAFVGVDTSGNLKMHTTAPTHDNYAVSTTAGKRRYATWSSTVYRILGWFYMDGASGGQVQLASNIKDTSVSNTIISNDNNTFTTTSTTDVRLLEIPFYASGGPINLHYDGDGSLGSSANNGFFNFSTDAVVIADRDLRSERVITDPGGSDSLKSSNQFLLTPAQTTRKFRVMARVDGNTMTVPHRSLIVREE